MPKIVYKFVADSTGLTTQLKQVSVQLDQVDQGAKNVGKHGVDAGGKFGAALEGAHGSARKLGGALSLIDPQLGAMVREAGHFAGGLALAEEAGESLLIGLGLVAGAVVIGAELYKHFGEEAEKANKKAEESAVDAAKAMIGEFAASDKGFLHAQKSADEARQKVIELKNEQGELAEKMKDRFQAEDQFNVGRARVLATNIEEAEKEAETAAESAKASAAAFETMKKNVDSVHDKKTRIAKAESAQQKALREEAERDQKAANDLFDTNEKVVAAEIEKAIQDLHTQSVQEAELRAELIQQHEENLKQHGPGGTDTTDQVREDKKALDDAATSTQAYGEIVSETAGNVAGLANSISDFSGLSQGAQIALAITTRAAALAQIAAHTGVAIAAATAAAAETGPGFPIALPVYEGLVYANALLAGAAVAAAPIPTHHAGSGEIMATTTRAYHDGAGNVPASLQSGEAVLNRAAAARLGRETINSMNRGMQPVAPSYTTNVIGHRVMDTWALKSLSRTNSPVRSAMQRASVGVRPGKRVRV